MRTGWSMSETSNARGDVVVLRRTPFKRTAAAMRLPSMALALVMSLGHVAGDAGDRVASTAAGRRPNEVSNGRVEVMKIRMNVEGEVVTATLDDNATSRDFVSLLPLTLPLKDYAQTEKISDLPKRLTTEGAPPGADPSVGDIAYYAPWGNLAIYYRDFEYSTGLVSLGTLTFGADMFASSRSMQVTIELAP